MILYAKIPMVYAACAVIVLCVHIQNGDGSSLEADCNATETADTLPTSPRPVTTTFSFRSDLLTRDECRKYKYLIPCSPVSRQLSCNHFENDDESLHEPRSKTYLEIRCDTRDRAEMGELVRNISGESPNRAITLELLERNGTDDPFHSDVFDPIRNQIIVLTAKSTTTITTSKIYAVGVLPNLFRLCVKSGRNLTIRKRNFSRMPNILMISFERSTIADIAPYTFTDLLTLQSLRLEVGMGLQLRNLLLESSSDTSISGATLGSWDVETLRRLHCDCSFAWLRNFLKEKDYLSDGKRKGIVFIVGNYLSPDVFDVQSLFGYEDALSVDCSQNLTVKSARVGTEFSYNTSCYKC